MARWLVDWRNLATLAASALVALTVFTVVDASQARDQAVAARVSASRSVDRLNLRIKELGDDLVGQSAETSERIGELLTQVAVLQEQVRQLGGHPVVIPTTTTTTAPPRRRTTTTTTAKPRRASTTTTSTFDLRRWATTTTTTCPISRNGDCGFTGGPQVGAPAAQTDPPAPTHGHKGKKDK